MRNAMRASEECINAIKGFETLELKAYKCPAGVLTIGYGHTRGVKEGQVITEVQADVLLKGDVLNVETSLNKLNLDLTQGQFDAIVDFCFNLGMVKFIGSTLYTKILVHASDDEVVTQFRRWVYGGGKKLDGLVKRREWEVQQWKRK
jgi:lysozyme